MTINFFSKDYIHRVGRTARAGRAGKAVTFVSQFDLELYLRIEQLLGKKLPKYESAEEEIVMTLAESVSEAQRYAQKELKELEDKKKSSKKRKKSSADNFDDSEQFVGVRDRMGKNKSKKRK